MLAALSLPVSCCSIWAEAKPLCNQMFLLLPESIPSAEQERCRVTPGLYLWVFFFLSSFPSVLPSACAVFGALSHPCVRAVHTWGAGVGWDGTVRVKGAWQGLLLLSVPDVRLILTLCLCPGLSGSSSLCCWGRSPPETPRTSSGTS